MKTLLTAGKFKKQKNRLPEFMQNDLNARLKKRVWEIRHHNMGKNMIDVACRLKHKCNMTTKEAIITSDYVIGFFAQNGYIDEFMRINQGALKKLDKVLEKKI